MRSNIVTIVQVIAIVVGALLASVVLAAIRNPFAVKFINLIFAMAAALFIIVVNGLKYLIARLGQFIAWLKYSISPDGDLSMANIVGPLVFLVALAALTASDAYLAILTIPQLVGGTPPNLNPNLLAPSPRSCGYASSSLCLQPCSTCSASPIFFIPTPSRRERIRTVMQIAAVAAFGIALLTAVLFGVFRHELADPLSTQVGAGFLDGILIVLFFVSVSLALVAAGPSLFEGFAPLMLVLCSILNVLAHVVAYILSFPIELLDRIAGLVVGLYDALATIGRAFWNYLAQITDGTRGELGEVPPLEERMHIKEVFRFPSV